VKAHEADWLRYAWGVVASGRQHVERCEAAGGVEMPGDAIARFPGFVGPDFVPGRGVLCMAHIHRYLPDVDEGEGGSLRGVEAAIVGWRQRGRSPESDATSPSLGPEGFEYGIGLTGRPTARNRRGSRQVVGPAGAGVTRAPQGPRAT